MEFFIILVAQTNFHQRDINRFLVDNGCARQKKIFRYPQNKLLSLLVGKNVNDKDFYWCPYHYLNGMWATHKLENCKNKDKHTPKEYDAVAHEKRFNSSVLTTTPSIPNKNNNRNEQNEEKTISFQLSNKLNSALSAISEGKHLDGSSFLAAYGLLDEVKE